MPGRARVNGEGSIFPYRNGFAATTAVAVLSCCVGHEAPECREG